MEISNQLKVGCGLKILQRAAVFANNLVGLPERLWHGKIVMQTGYRLHQTAVAMTEAMPIKGLHLANIGATILSNRDLYIRSQGAGHARYPQHLVVLEVLQGEAMDIFQHLQAFVDIAINRGDEFKQGFGKIGGDVGVSECRS